MKLKICTFKPLFNVIKREFKRIFTSSDLLLICLIAPLFYGLLFSYLYINKRPVDIPVGIINMDNSAMSRKLVRNLDASPELKIDKTYTSPLEAYEGIFENDLGAFYFIPRDFSANLKKGKSASAFNAANSSSFLISSNVLKNMNSISVAFTQKQFVKLLVDKGYSYEAAKAAFTPLKADIHYIYNTEMNYSDFLLPFLLFAVLQQIILVAVATTMSLEKTKGTLKDLYQTANGNFFYIIAGKAIPYIFLGIFLNLINIFIMFPIDSIYIQSVSGFMLLSTAFIIAVTFFAVLISYLFRSPEFAMAVLMFYALPTVMLSGIAWPHHALPLALKIVSFLFPSTYALTSLRLFILGDMSIHYAVMPSLILIIFALICFIFSYYIERKRKKDYITA